MGVEESENFVLYLVRLVWCRLVSVGTSFTNTTFGALHCSLRPRHIYGTQITAHHNSSFASHHPCESMLTNQRIELKSIRSKIQYLARLLVRVFIAEDSEAECHDM